MTRELKFRAWVKSESRYMGKWLNTQQPTTFSVINEAAEYYSDDDLIVEQYTGLKDKNGKEIYEGDILRWEYRFMDGRKSTNTMIVRWNQSECCFEIHFIKGNFGDSMLDDDSCDEYEVIGNIHENPELLEGEK